MSKAIRHRLMVLAQALAGLGLMGWGLYQVSPALSAIIIGAVVFALAVLDAWIGLRRPKAE